MRYRNDIGAVLDYSGTGGPTAQPGEVFEHEGPEVDSHFASGFISRVDPEPTRKGAKSVSRDVGDE